VGRFIFENESEGISKNCFSPVLVSPPDTGVLISP